jgi:hypothetical protein
MPDDLVVCFTMSRQSIDGAITTAKTVLMERDSKSGGPKLRVWPVAMLSGIRGPRQFRSTDRGCLGTIRGIAMAPPTTINPLDGESHTAMFRMA